MLVITNDTHAGALSDADMYLSTADGFINVSIPIAVHIIPTNIAV